MFKAIVISNLSVNVNVPCFKFRSRFIDQKAKSSFLSYTLILKATEVIYISYWIMITQLSNV